MSVEFAINRPRYEGKPSALLPTLGETVLGDLPRGLQAFKARSVDDYIVGLHAAIGDMAGSAQSNLLEAAKALGATPPQAFSYSSMSFMPDPTNYGLMQWPGLNPESLQKICRENIAPIVIIRNRCDDLARYSVISDEIWKPGWRITMRDSHEEVTNKDRDTIKEITKFVYNCSMDGDKDPRDRDKHLIPPFEYFMRSFGNDTLTFDGWSIWTDMDSNDRVRAFANLPAGMIRLAIPTRGYKGNTDYFAALVDETGNPVKAFTREEMTWRVRNVRNDPSVMGYGWPEPEMAIRLIQAFQGAIDLNADVFCYSADTEVLTRDGWRTFDQVEIGREEFATLNLITGAFEYQQATQKVWQDYQGDMYHLTSRSVDLFVTPNHRVITQYRPSFISRADDRYTIYQAEDIHIKMQTMTSASRKNYCLPMVSLWTGEEIGDQIFARYPPHYNRESQQLTGDDYCALLGAYLSEGSIATIDGERRDRFVIHQERYSRGYEPYRQLLIRILGKEPGYTGDRFYVDWYGLTAHLKGFGSDCYTKHIPTSILNATPRQQQIFWDYYMLGDGSVEVNGRQHIATTSKLMADQLQELVQKMGFAATIHKVEPKTGDAIDGVIVKTRATRYDVYLKTSIMQSFDTEKGAYQGKIGCVSVPNSTLYVRRGGKAAWCGNSRNSIPNGIMVLKGDYFNQEQIDALTREWTNMKRGVSKLWGLPVIAIPEDGEIEILPFMDMKGEDVRYRDHMNMTMGLCCLVWRFPIRRLGMFVSGHRKDNEPVADAAIEIQGADDPGLPPLLSHVEETVNPYLLWPRWPDYKFEFLGKNPKEDARQYEARRLARTWGEARREANLPKLSKIAPPELKGLADILEMAPEDTVKAGVFQTIAGEMIKAQLGTAGGDGDGKPSGGGSPAKPGSPIMPVKDPAERQGHGTLAGVRRDSRAEKDQAALKVKV